MKPGFSGLLFLLVLAVVIAGCEGDRGPAGPPGPSGTTFDFTYVGNSGEDCMHCHASIVSTWVETGHEKAYRDLDNEDRANLYCLQCHTVGFDSEVAFGDTEILPENYGPDVNGFDDYVNVETDEAEARRLALEGVQCESCHGPMGPDFNEHRPVVSFATHVDEITGESTSMCFPCHEGQLEEWVESGHGSVQEGSITAFNDEHYVNNPSCDGCHTSEGFIKKNDPAYATYSFPAQQSFIGCPTCHDPHMGESTAGGNIYQLRNLAAVEVNYDFGTSPGDEGRPRMEGYGSSQTCAQCHKGRRDNAHVTDQIDVGYDHFGPHGSPQMDMFIGAGSYEIPGFTYNGNGIHKLAVADGCVECHMVREVMLHGELQDHAFHSFEPDVGNCEPCHTLTDFNYNNVQTTIEGKMDQLAQLLGYADTATLLATWNTDNYNVPRWQREAAYALVFVNNDGSRGVHNPAYANSLLDNAISYATSPPPVP